MVAHYLWKACLLTAILVLGATGAQAESSNPEDGTHAEPTSTEDDQSPCTLVLLRTEEPYVDIHWDCLEDLIGSSP